MRGGFEGAGWQSVSDFFISKTDELDVGGGEMWIIYTAVIKGQWDR